MMAGEKAHLFRAEALSSLEQPAIGGEPLQLSPGWTRCSYWVLVAFFVAAMVYVWVAFVNEYATGSAIIRVDGRTDVTATSAGTVVGIDAQPGQRVTRGQVLVRLYSGQEAADLDRLRNEFDLHLVKFLRDPMDAVAREALVSLRGQRELAVTRLAERSLRAPSDGVVSDVRIRVGQLLGAGDLVLSLIGDHARFALLAFLPGQYRPLLNEGMPLRVEIVGFPYNYIEVPIESIADEIVGPSETRRFVGADVGDTLPFGGPMLLVRSTLAGRTFTFDRNPFNYYDGTVAKVEARVRRRRIVTLLVPALRLLLPQYEDGVGTSSEGDDSADDAESEQETDAAGGQRR